MSSQAVQNLPMLGLIVGIGAIAFVGVVLMIVDLCRQLVVQTGLSSLYRQGSRRNK
jgi:hypothetical protein